MNGESGILIYLYPGVWSVQMGTRKSKPRASTHVRSQSRELLPCSLGKHHPARMLATVENYFLADKLGFVIITKDYR